MALSLQPDPQPSAHPPAVLGRYEIIREIACGGMATVYLANELKPGEGASLVAIKCCHPHLRRDPVFAAMFLDEARLAARIHHPNVVETLDIGETDPLYFAMQYVDGTSLAEWLKHSAVDSTHKLRVDLLLRILIDALSGLHAAHELCDESGQPLHLIHRDVSPQNLLIGFDGITRIADFGIAKAEKRATRTRTGQVKGKTGYMPPEQILGEPIDRRADVYAAGVVLWEALVGKRLFDAESDAAVINQVLNGQVSAPSVLCGAPTELDAIVKRALRYSPDERFATALEFADALRATRLEIAPMQAVGAALRCWLAPNEDTAQRATPPRRPTTHPSNPLVTRGRALLALLFLFASALLLLRFRTWSKRAADLPPVDPTFVRESMTSTRAASNPMLTQQPAEQTRLQTAGTYRDAHDAIKLAPQRSTLRAPPLTAASAVRSEMGATGRSRTATPATAAPAASSSPSSSESKSSSRKPAEFRPQDL